ncbi:DNA (cytosine-5-)-methyltransferase [Streptomyces sp. SID5475]|nr:DNA (cytosine-5-)-methyltransferase [Streptomyces sp. SID5475]
MDQSEHQFPSVEVCAGAGGQAVGLHGAGFRHRALVELDADACATLRKNVLANPEWDGCEVLQRDLKSFEPADLGCVPEELALLSGGVPCPPFSSAGKRLGREDDRDLFPVMLKWIDHLRPRAVMIENVKNLMERKFDDYREEIAEDIQWFGYKVYGWNILKASDFGVPQYRPRAIFVAIRKDVRAEFHWPDPAGYASLSVADALVSSMYRRFRDSGEPGWNDGYERWLGKAESGKAAPTLVGGSKKHGGADLGPTRAKWAWRQLGVDGTGVAEEPGDLKHPERDLYGPLGPKLTVSQAAILQGFPEGWKFSGRKTAAYRQVGNAFPPPVAQAVGESIMATLRASDAASAGQEKARALVEPRVAPRRDRRDDFCGTVVS